jgi:ATP-binding cassette subfamily B multidrug efflux pump
MNSFKWIFPYIKLHKFKMAAGLFLSLITSILAMINPYMSGKIVDDVILGKNTGALLVILCIMFGATLFRSSIKYFYQLIFEDISQRIYHRIREEMYIKIQSMDFVFFDKVRTGDIMARMTGDMDAVRHFLSFVIYQIFENGANFLFSLTMLFIINYKLALVTLLITPITAFVTYHFTKEVKPAFSAIREQFSKLNTVVQENISGNRVVKAFTKEAYEIQKFEEQNNEFKKKNIESANIWAKYLPILDSMGGVLTVVMILAGGIMVIRKDMTVGQLVTFNSFIWALIIPMRMSGWLVNDVQRFAASGEKVIELMNREPSISNSEEPVVKNRFKGVVEFKSVSFSYGDEEVLEDISFKVSPGQTIAVLGPTGSGKSTLVNLICRFYDTNNGDILIDKIDIKEIDLKTLRENIAVAMQDIFLFSDTIEGNIAYGLPHASEEEVQWAASAAGAHDFISGFPEGYDTIIGERGVGLSGGQKQRIALARTILKNPSILILDDTTSSLDIKTEQKIQNTLNSFFADKTTFIIAHRITSVKNADLILVLENGKIVERGLHEELLANRSYYYNVFMNQFGDFDSKQTKSA